MIVAPHQLFVVKTELLHGGRTYVVDQYSAFSAIASSAARPASLFRFSATLRLFLLRFKNSGPTP